MVLGSAGRWHHEAGDGNGSASSPRAYGVGRENLQVAPGGRSPALADDHHPLVGGDVAYQSAASASVQAADDGGGPYPDFTQVNAVRLAFVTAYVLVIVVSIVGNALVCLAVYRNKKMHTAVNYYIVNLALCDLLVGAFVMPVKLVELTAPSEWSLLNDGFCTGMMYFQTVFVFTSVLTLVAISVERYFAIVHPLESRMHHSKSRAKRILLFVWLTSCVVSSPFLRPAKAYENFLYSDYGAFHRLNCFDSFTEEFRRAYYIFLFVFIYLLSLCFITGTCTRIFRVLLQGISFHRQGSLRRQESNRRKVAKMVIVVVFSYVVFWTPYFVVTIVTQLQSENFLQQGHFFFTMLCVNFLAFTNSCVNPFIYGTMSVRFRHGFHSIFVILCCSLCRHLRRGLFGGAVGDVDGALEDSKFTKSYFGCGAGRTSSSCFDPSLSDSPPSSSPDASATAVVGVIGNDVVAKRQTDSIRGSRRRGAPADHTPSKNCNAVSSSRRSSRKNRDAVVLPSARMRSAGEINGFCSPTGDVVSRKMLSRPAEVRNTNGPLTTRASWHALAVYASSAKKRLLKLIGKRQPVDQIVENNSDNDTKSPKDDPVCAELSRDKSSEPSAVTTSPTVYVKNHVVAAALLNTNPGHDDDDQTGDVGEHLSPIKFGECLKLENMRSVSQQISHENTSASKLCVDDHAQLKSFCSCYNLDQFTLAFADVGAKRFYSDIALNGFVQNKEVSTVV